MVLLYTQPAVPVLIAISDGPPAPIEAVVLEIIDELPQALYVHVTPALLETLGQRYTVVDASRHLKLALTRIDLVERYSIPVDVLAIDDLHEISAFYESAYPETWFDARMLATGRYVGVRADAQLVCIAGVHVHSRAFGVAALGNVATVPALRGQGLARGVCAALCQLLLSDGIETIGLNVAADNAAALASYAKLGFEQVTAYTEASLLAEEL